MTNIHNSILKVTVTTVLVAVVGVISTLGGGTILAMLNACSYDDVMSMEPLFLMSRNVEPVLHAAAAEPICPSNMEGFLFVGVLLFVVGFLFHGLLNLGCAKRR